MEDSSLGFGGESPILFNHVKIRPVVESRDKNKLHLEDLHKRLIQHLKKRDVIQRQELKNYFDQVQKIHPEDHKSKWLLMKIKGLLTYIIKKRSDFQHRIVNGEITIYEKSATQEVMNESFVPEPPSFHSQPVGGTFDLAATFLTNDNFVTVNSSPNGQSMELETTYDHSKDLFPETIESLRKFSQNNYQMLKGLTTSSIQEDETFKVPQDVNVRVKEVYKIHDMAEENYKLLSSTPPNVPPGLIEQYDTEIFDQNILGNKLFDNLEITNEYVKDDMKIELENSKKFVSELTNNLILLQLDEKAFGMTLQNMQGSNNESLITDGVPLQPYYSEENLRIIREVRLGFKRNLQETLKTKKNSTMLREMFRPYKLA